LAGGRFRGSKSEISFGRILIPAFSPWSRGKRFPEFGAILVARLLDAFMIINLKT
jgi:hypothetical protein